MSKQAAEKPSRIAPVEAGRKIQLPEEWAADLGIRLWWLVVRLKNWGMATLRERTGQPLGRDNPAVSSQLKSRFLPEE